MSAAALTLDYGLLPQPLTPELVTYDELLGEWQRVAPWLEPALATCGGTHWLEDVLAAIVAANMQLWTGSHTAAVTEICQFPRMKLVNVFLAGGRLRDCLEWGAPGGPLEHWAKGIGAQALTADARAGWSRKLAGVTVLNTQMIRRI